ncbi:hypothetical protein D3C87_1081200 [compost metagenome]
MLNAVDAMAKIRMRKTSFTEWIKILLSYKVIRNSKTKILHINLSLALKYSLLTTFRAKIEISQMREVKAKGG